MKIVFNAGIAAGRPGLPAANPKFESEEAIMKKVFCLLLAMCMVLALAACSGGGNNQAANNQPPADTNQPADNGEPAAPAEPSSGEPITVP